MRKRTSGLTMAVSLDLVRGYALGAARASVAGHRLADLVGRARAFEAWLIKQDHVGVETARRALFFACEDGARRRRGVRAGVAGTRALLRRAEVYRDFLVGAA